MSLSKVATIGLAMMSLASSAYGHMIMANPVPYGKSTLNNSPLDASGSDFPCKQRQGVYQVDTMNKMQAGSSQQLSFTGSAVHGGGSCQLSITTDKEPTANSKFKVIYSIEGGCPGVSGPSTFPFTMPKEVPNGQATLAWTWFNKIGNREMYMNCAPVEISGGASDTKEFDALPDMAVANLANKGTCKTTESSDYTFQDPGKYTTKVGNGPFANLCGGAAGAAPNGQQPGTMPNTGAAQGQPTANPGIPSGNPGVPSANPGIPTPSSQAATPSVPTASAPDGAGSSNAAPVMSTSTATTLVTVTAAPSSAQTSQAPLQNSDAPMASEPAGAAPSQPAAPVGNGTAAGTGSPCSQDGAIVCNGADQFGLCDHGHVVFQPVAAGTKCENGQIAKRYVHRAQRLY